MLQRDLLLPWRTALDNAIVGLEIQGVSRASARQRARDLFRSFGLAEFAGHYPPALSGGMRQRVSFARSALPAHGLLLLDEPFGALDSLTRTAMQEWVLGVWAGLGLTILMVTHDLDEAVLLSARVYALTPRPARIAAVEDVALPARRTLDSLTDPAFHATKARLLKALRASGSLPTASSGGPAI
jgi:ABC-type nitrate/sulfonate/bicarbonate transport system ATPase subunit